jgi:hypothetical protein
MMDVFGPRNQLEADLPADITAALSEELQPDDRIVCPLSIGGHIDHVLVREAVEALKLPLWFYADVPYILRNPETLESSIKGLKAQSFPVTQKGLAAWLDGIAAYKSQIKMLFEAEEKMRETIRAYWADGKNIRLWH